VFRPTYTSRGPNGERITKQVSAWYIEYTDYRGKTKRKKAGLTREDAKDALRAAEARGLRERNELPTVKAGDVVCSKLAEDYLAEQARQVSEAHRSGLEQRLKAVLEATKAVCVRDLTPEAVDTFLDGLAADGLAAKTINEYLQAIRGLLTWAVKRRKLTFNPLDCLSKREGEKVRKRRPLTEEECGRLMAAAMRGPVRRLERAYKGADIPTERLAEARQQGERNALIYTIMVQTGLRLNEVRNLRWKDVDLEGGVLECRAEWTKNAKDAELPLHPQLAERLRQWKDAQEPAEDDVVVKIPARILDRFNDDLAAAKIDKADAAGRTVDLHSLRHTFATRLNNAGVDPKTLQGLMRHSTPMLSLGLYVHNDRARMAEAVMGLADPTAVNPEPQRAAKTGTDDLPEGRIEPQPPSIRQAQPRHSRKSLETKAQVNPDGPGSHPGDRGSNPLGGSSRPPAVSQATARGLFCL